MRKLKVPNTYVILFFALLLCALSTWLIPQGKPQTWQVLSALYDGFIRQAGIISFVLIIGGAFWVINQTKAVDDGIMRFIARTKSLERHSWVRHLGVGNIVIVLIMLLFGVFGAVFGMSEETIAFAAVVIPLAKSLGYDEYVGVCMVYLAAHVGFAGAMLNPFTIGIAQDLSALPLFSGIEYRTMCWVLLMFVAIVFVLWYASRHKSQPQLLEQTEQVESLATTVETQPTSAKRSWICYAVLSAVMLVSCVQSASSCVVKIGQSQYEAPYLLWMVTAAFMLVSYFALRTSVRMFILNLLLFSIVFLVVGTMGFGWYLPEICALFMGLGIAAGFCAGYSADTIAQEFMAGAKDIFSAALVIGFAAGLIVILENGEVIDTMLNAMANALKDTGREGALLTMYGIQTFINVFIPSASAKAAVTIPIMAPFSDMIGVSRQATVLAFQFGDGFTNMITPCSGVLMAVLSIAKIPYERWVKFIWKFILTLIILGILLLLPTLYFTLPGF
ncbi:MAG: YfcC family protein [Bacteroidaceae bacterium]|nr:YfcC family protein [Bacteroidaceae bacterium]